MRIVIQRVSESAVSVQGTKIAEIGHGILILFGAGKNDTPNFAEAMAKRCGN